jgi:hypothetical protein
LTARVLSCASEQIDSRPSVNLDAAGLIEINAKVPAVFIVLPQTADLPADRFGPNAGFQRPAAVP